MFRLNSFYSTLLSTPLLDIYYYMVQKLVLLKSICRSKTEIMDKGIEAAKLQQRAIANQVQSFLDMNPNHIGRTFPLRLRTGGNYILNCSIS